VVAAITRLRLRSWRFLLPFMIHASRSQKQAMAAPGCFGVRTRKTRGLAFWTLTAWESEAQLRAFLSSDPHRATMPKLPAWCDEAVTTHWTIETKQLPDWQVGTAKLLEGGRLLRVKYPSGSQKSGVINVD